MPKLNVLNIQGQNVGEIELSDAVFGVEVNEHVLYEVVKNQLANKRQGTQSAKTRAEVRGGGRKPWRQKGTGRARQGSIRAVQWIGGGVAFAPKPRSYRYTLPKKVRRLAMKSALTSKVQANEMIVLDALTMDAPKTKEFATILNNVNAAKKALVVMAEKNENVIKSAANIPNVETALVNTINVYDILKYDSFIITTDAVKKVGRCTHKMTNPHDIVIRPIVTEQSMADMADRKYTFVVQKGANKTEIKKAVEKIFGVDVEKVNTLNYDGKVKRMGRSIGKTASYKKAVVKLTADSKEIEFFQGM